MHGRTVHASKTIALLIQRGGSLFWAHSCATVVSYRMNNNIDSAGIESRNGASSTISAWHLPEISWTACGDLDLLPVM